MSRRPDLAACVLLAVLFAGCASAPTAPRYVTGSPGIATPGQTPISSPTARSSPLPNFTHIYVLLMENKETESVIGSSAAPYINSLARQYGTATNFFGTSHPSLPNYLELVGGSTFGVTSDCLACYVNATNLVDQLEAAHKSWRAYMEDMPAPCFVGYSGDYAQKHTPFIYFDDIRQNPTRCANIVPLTQWNSDMAQNHLADFIWITPNLCHDMHDCSVSTGDTWLKSFLPTIFAAPDWQSSALFLLWDEGSSGAGCCQLAHGGHIPMLLISPLAKPGFTSSVNYDHASVLRTIEEAWGLDLLRDAACTCTAALADFFAGA